MLKQWINNAITISTSLGPDDGCIVENVLSESGISATFRADAPSTGGHLALVALQEIHRHNLGKLVKDVRVKTLFVGCSMYEVKSWGSFGWATFHFSDRDSRDTGRNAISMMRKAGKAIACKAPGGCDLCKRIQQNHPDLAAKKTTMRLVLVLWPS